MGLFGDKFKGAWSMISNFVDGSCDGLSRNYSMCQFGDCSLEKTEHAFLHQVDGTVAERQRTKGDHLRHLLWNAMTLLAIHLSGNIAHSPPNSIHTDHQMCDNRHRNHTRVYDPQPLHTMNPTLRIHPFFIQFRLHRLASFSLLHQCQGPSASRSQCRMIASRGTKVQVDQREGFRIAGGDGHVATRCVLHAENSRCYGVIKWERFHFCGSRVRFYLLQLRE